MAGIPTKITTHETDAFNRLLSQFKEKEKLSAMITAFAGQKQKIEDALFDVYTKRQVNTAFGKTMDKIGTIIGRNRRGMTDSAYRYWLYGQIGINTGKGTNENVINIFKFLTQTNKVTIYHYYPAHIFLQANTDISGLDLQTVLYICQQVVPAGVKVIGIGWYVDPDPEIPDAEVFMFAGSEQGKGFGDLDDPDIGGKFSKLQVWA